MKRLVAIMVLFVTFNGLSAAEAGEITLAGKKLAAYLDGLEVEKLWLPGKYVKWEDGKSSDDPIKGVGKQTHCSAFVAAVCARREVYILRPPEHAQIRLANAQAAWLQKEGSKHGWKPVKSAWEAQQYANKGDLIVAAYKETGTKTVKGKVVPRPGHIAVVRPSTRGMASIEKDGPQIIQAGGTNANSTTLKKGFSHHPDAWGKLQVRFYRHELSWK